MNQSSISTSLMMRALAFYQDYGFKPFSVPMVVPEAVSGNTAPDWVEETYHSEGMVYTGSAEQGFMHLISQGQLPQRDYMALTPCIRHEQAYTDTSYRVFLKLELISFPNQSRNRLVNAAASFWGRVGLGVTSVPTSTGVDLLSPEGLELGSYGVRDVEGKHYAYGTGLAEPRGSIALRGSRG